MTPGMARNLGKETKMQRFLIVLLVALLAGTVCGDDLLRVPDGAGVWDGPLRATMLPYTGVLRLEDSSGIAWQLTCAICGQDERSSYCDMPGCLVYHDYTRPDSVCGFDLCYDCRQKYRKALTDAVARIIAEAKEKDKDRIEARRQAERAQRLREIDAKIKALDRERAELK